MRSARRPSSSGCPSVSVAGRSARARGPGRSAGRSGRRCPPYGRRRSARLGGLGGLIIAGGESTAIGRLMRLYGLDEAVRGFGGPILGTCAGMIVLDRDHLGLGDYRTRRNAFGRQVRSFEADLDIGDGDEPLRAVFIRAPWLEEAGPDA